MAKISKKYQKQKKNSLYKASQSTKNIFLMFSIGVFMLIFFVGIVSAFEFDNVLTYSEKDMKVDFTNAFGLGADLGTAELKSHPSVDYVLPVGYGSEQVVMYYDINFIDIYENGLGNVYFTDMRTGKQVEKTYSFVYWGEYEVDDYQNVEVETLKNGTIVYENKKVGMKTLEGWLPYNSRDIPKGNLRIGLKTYVAKDDYMDAVWVIAGKKVDKHASWEASLNTGLVQFLYLDETSGTDVIDELGAFNGTNDGVTIGGTGINNYSYNFDTNTDEVVFSTSLKRTSGDRMHSFWIKTTDSDSIRILYGDSSSADWGRTISLDEGLIRLDMYSGSAYMCGGNGAFESAVAVNNGSWQHIVVGLGGGNCLVYVNGVLNKSTAEAGTTTRSGSSTGAYIGGGLWPDASPDFEMDLWGTWDRELTQEEITNLYNEGNPVKINETDDKSPNITISVPADNYNSTNPSVTFGCVAYDDIKVDEVYLFVDGLLNDTNTAGTNNTNYTFTETFAIGEHNWTCGVCDNSSQCVNESWRDFNITETPDNYPSVTLGIPVNHYNTTDSSVTLSCKASDDINLDTTRLILNGGEEHVNNTPINDSFMNVSVSLVEGLNNWTCEGCDNASQCLNASYRYITLDTIDPILTSVNNVTDFATYSLPTASYWNYTVVERNPDKCYYNTSDNSTYTIVTCNASITTNWITGGSKTIQYCANDSLSHETCNTTSMTIYYVQDSQTDNPDPIAEGYNANFTLVVNLTSIPTTTANLILNGTTYPATSTASGSDYYIFNSIVNIPNTFGNTTGVTYDWNWSYNISGVTSKTTSTENITVYEVAIDDCTDYTETILNISLKDEETNVFFNESDNTTTATVELELILTSKDNSSVTYSYANSWSDNSSIQICVPTNILNNTEYQIDFTIGFENTDHVWEFFYLDHGDLNSSKVFDTQTNYTINLMDLLTADSTSFLFNYFDQDGLPVEDAIVHVYRKYIGEGIFREVERSKADDNGDTIIHLVEEDVIYYYLISQYGVPLYTSSTSTALCQETPCTIQVEASGGETVTFGTNYDLIDGGAIEITQNTSTRIVTLTYALNESATMNFTIYKYDNDGSITALNSTTSTGTSGSMQVYIPMTAGNVSFFANVRKDNQFIKTQWIDFESDASDFFGTTLALFIAGLIILTLALAGVTEGSATIILVILGIFLSGALGLISTKLNTGVNIVIYLILAGGLILWKLTRSKG